LKWVADIGALLAARPPEAVERLVAEAEAGLYLPAVAQGLCLAHRLLDAPLPPAMAERLASRPGTAGAVGQAMAALTAGGGAAEASDRVLGALRMTLSHFRLQRDPAYLWFETRALAGAVLRAARARLF
jgi:hypothetical protein